MATGSAPRLRICFFNRSYHPDQGATGQLLTDLAEDLARDGRHEVWVVAGPPLLRSAPLGSARRARARWALPVRARGTKRRADPARVGHRAPAGALRRARGELPELLRLVVSGRARGAPARRGRRADRSADHRPGRARVRPAHRRALRLPLPGRVPRGGAPRSATSGASGSIGCSSASRAGSSPARTASWRSARRCASGSWPARTPIPARVTVIHNWADCSAIVPGPKRNPWSLAHGLAEPFVVMHSGNIGLSQDLDVLIDAAARLVRLSRHRRRHRRRRGEARGPRGPRARALHSAMSGSCPINRASASPSPSPRPIASSSRSRGGSPATSCRASSTGSWPPDGRTSRRSRRRPKWRRSPGGISRVSWPSPATPTTSRARS